MMEATGRLQIEVEGVGVLDVRGGAGEVVFLGYDGKDEVFRGHPLAVDELHFIYESTGDGVLLVAEYGTGVYWFSAPERSLSRVVDLARQPEDDRAFMATRIIRGDGVLIVAYERGILAVCLSGELLWHSVDRDLTHELDGISDGRAWYNDATGKRWAYDVVTGERSEPSI